MKSPPTKSRPLPRTMTFPFSAMTPGLDRGDAMRFAKSVQLLLVLLFLSPLVSSAQEVADKNPLSPYPSPQQRQQEVYDLAAEHPDRVEVSEFGKSVQGRPLLVMYVHRRGEDDKPAAFIGANIHGNEWIGNRMAMAIARMLVLEDGKDPIVTEAMQSMDFFIAPCLNPDGYQTTWDHPYTEDWGLCRKNANSVDLNRNFPMPGRFTLPIDKAGSPDPESVHYRGPAPLSEPETRAVDRFFQEHPEIVGAISWHSYAAVMFPAHCPGRACMKRHKKMCKAYKKHQPHKKYPRLQTRVFDCYTGEMEDWLYAEYGAIATDIEIGKKRLNKKACDCDDLFWIFNPQNPEWWVENDAKAGIAAMLEACRITGGKRIPEQER